MTVVPTTGSGLFGQVTFHVAVVPSHVVERINPTTIAVCRRLGSWKNVHTGRSIDENKNMTKSQK